MSHLLRAQIQESCKLALPEGLQELLSDISREVLRTQPQHLYQFIADYLEALLRARETLSIACQVCAETCECTCEPELYTELQNIGLSDDDAGTAVEIIEKHLKGGSVKEESVLIKLMNKTSLEESQILEVQQAVQRAFKRRLINEAKLETITPIGLPVSKKRNTSVSSPSLAEAWTHEMDIFNESSEKSDIDDNTVQDIENGKVKITPEVGKEGSSNESEAYNETESCANESDNDTAINKDIEEVNDINDSECSVEEVVPEEMLTNDFD